MNLDLTSRGVLGLGKVSTLYYLNEIQRKYQLSRQELSTCPLVMYQIDFQKVNFFLPNQFEVLIPTVENYFKQITDIGISKLLIPNITLHETVDQMKFLFKICHPVDLIIEYLSENNISEIYLFGTLYTMNSEYMRFKFSDKNITILKPSETDEKWIDDFRKSVCSEKKTLQQIKDFQNLITKYSINIPVVIACTELSMYTLKNNSKCIDMADLQINEFLKV